MNIFTKKNIQNATIAFEHTLKALYDIEKGLLAAQPKMRDAAKDSTLRDAFSAHIEETQRQIARLEDAFRRLDIEPDTLTCEGVRGIVKDAEWVIKDVEAPALIKDAMLAKAARHAEHYEMAAYMGAILEANALGYTEISSLLSETLEEEENADRKLAAAQEANLT